MANGEKPISPDAAQPESGPSDSHVETRPDDLTAKGGSEPMPGSVAKEPSSGRGEGNRPAGHGLVADLAREREHRRNAETELSTLRDELEQRTEWFETESERMKDVAEAAARDREAVTERLARIERESAIRNDLLAVGVPADRLDVALAGFNTAFPDHPHDPNDPAEPEESGEAGDEETRPAPRLADRVRSYVERNPFLKSSPLRTEPIGTGNPGSTVTSPEADLRAEYSAALREYRQHPGNAARYNVLRLRAELRLAGIDPAC